MGKKTVNENTTVVDLRKKAPQPVVDTTGKQGAIAVEAPLDSTNASSEKPKQFTPADKKLKLPKINFKSKTTIAMLIGLVLIVAGAVAIVIKKQQENAKLDCDKKYCQQILTSAAIAFNSNRIADQEVVVKRITAIKNYQKQPNYDVILTQYYINRSDYDNAQKNLTLLKKVYVSDVGYNPTLYNTNVIQPPAQLEQAVAALKAMQQNLKQNSYGVSSDGTVQGTAQ